MASEWVNDIDQSIADKIHEFAKEYLTDDSPVVPLAPDATGAEKALYVTKFLMKAATNENYAKALSIVTRT